MLEITQTEDKPSKTQNKSSAIRPPIKVVGGKTYLLPVIREYLPKTFGTKETVLVEPFLGGAALTLDLIARYGDKISTVLNDFNPDVAAVWNMLHPTTLEEFISELKLLQSDTSEEAFQRVKQQFNSKKTHPARSFIPIHVARFLYLNKTAFNGLTRYNSKGEYNSPYGKYKSPRIFDEQNLRNLSSVLWSNPGSEEKIFNLDFQTIIENVCAKKKTTKHSFFYLDPPYIPVSLTSSFVNYTPNGFTLYDQKRLALSCDLINKCGGKFMLSNSDTPATREIFGGFNFIEVTNKRSCSALVKGRGKIKELLITNY